MRDPDRIDAVLEALEALWRRYPDLRFAQLIVSASPARFKFDPFYLEDDELLACLLAFPSTPTSP